MSFQATSRSEKAYRNSLAWLRSLLSFVVVVLFLLALRKAKTPANGALLGIIAVVVQIGISRGTKAFEKRHTSRSLTVRREMQP